MNDLINFGLLQMNNLFFTTTKGTTHDHKSSSNIEFSAVNRKIVEIGDQGGHSPNYHTSFILVSNSHELPTRNE